MANIKSAKKRVKINQRNNRRNSSYRSKAKTFIKKYLILINDYQTNEDKIILDKIQISLKLAFSQIDKATKKKVYHKNNAARKKANLQKLYNQL